MEIEVEEGCIEINSAVVLNDSDDAVLIHLDLTQKYAEAIPMWISNGEAIVGVHPKEGTLYVEPHADKTTLVRIFSEKFKHGDWTIEAEVGRYTMQIMAVLKAVKFEIGITKKQTAVSSHSEEK